MRQQKGSWLPCFGNSSAPRQAPRQARQPSGGRQDGARPDNNTVIKRIIAQNKERRQQNQVVQQQEVELGAAYQQVSRQESNFSQL